MTGLDTTITINRYITTTNNYDNNINNYHDYSNSATKNKNNKKCINYNNGNNDGYVEFEVISLLG